LKQSFPNVSIGFDFEIAKDNVRKLHQANVPILAGSDAPNPGTAYGATLHKEMELLVASGLSPMEALKAGTSGASTYFNLPKTGHIQEGMPANIILINGQPDLNISDSAKIDTIFLNGRKIPRTTAQLSAQNASINPSNLIVDEYLGDFEMGLTTSHGYIWSETSDKMANGQSIALVTRVMEGAFPKTKKSNWSLRVTGETKPGFIFPWSGAFLRFSQDFSQAFSVEPYRTIRFDIKGKPGDYQILIFSRDNMTNPGRQSCSVSKEWQTIRLSLDQFSTLDKSQVTGLSIIAGPELGSVDFSIDNVVLERRSYRD